MTTSKTLILKRAPGTRAPRYGKHTIVALVHADAYAAGGYRHPTVDLGYNATWDGVTRFERIATIRFQQHYLVGPHTPPRGFLAQPGWSGAYGAEIAAPCEYATQRKALRAALALLDRAADVASRTYYARSDAWKQSPKRQAALACDLLALVVGLRHVGVDATVYRPTPVSVPRGGYGSLAVAS